MERIEWQAPEYIHKEKLPDWHWIVGIIAVSIVIVSIILNNIIFAVLIGISAVTLSLYATRKPEIIPIELDWSGIKINDAFHPIADFESFWVETRDAYPRIFLEPKKKIAFHTIVVLGNADPDDVREILAQHLPEKEHTEPFLEKLLFYFGF